MSRPNHLTIVARTPEAVAAVRAFAGFGYALGPGRPDATGTRRVWGPWCSDPSVCQHLRAIPGVRVYENRLDDWRTLAGWQDPPTE